MSILLYSFLSFFFYSLISYFFSIFYSCLFMSDQNQVTVFYNSGQIHITRSTNDLFINVPNKILRESVIVLEGSSLLAHTLYVKKNPLRSKNELIGASVKVQHPTDHETEGILTFIGEDQSVVLEQKDGSEVWIQTVDSIHVNESSVFKSSIPKLSPCSHISIPNKAYSSPISYRYMSEGINSTVTYSMIVDDKISQLVLCPCKLYITNETDQVLKTTAGSTFYTIGQPNTVHGSRRRGGFYESAQSSAMASLTSRSQPVNESAFSAYERIPILTPIHCEPRETTEVELFTLSQFPIVPLYSIPIQATGSKVVAQWGFRLNSQHLFFPVGQCLIRQKLMLQPERTTIEYIGSYELDHIVPPKTDMSLYIGSSPHVCGEWKVSETNEQVTTEGVTRTKTNYNMKGTLTSRSSIFPNNKTCVTWTSYRQSPTIVIKKSFCRRTSPISTNMTSLAYSFVDQELTWSLSSPIQSDEVYSIELEFSITD